MIDFKVCGNCAHWSMYGFVCLCMESLYYNAGRNDITRFNDDLPCEHWKFCNDPKYKVVREEVKDWNDGKKNA